MSETKTEITLKEKITKWATSVKSTMKTSQSLVLSAIEHTFKTGDPVYLNQMLRVIEDEGKNYIRRAPYIEFVLKNAPVKATKVEPAEGKAYHEFALDKDRRKSMDMEATLATAAKTNWWNAKPDVEQTAFDLLSFEKAMLHVVKTHAGRMDDETDPADRRRVQEYQDRLENEVSVLAA